MTEAIIKVSWRRSILGFVLEGGNQAVGGIAGSCFTLSSGITLSCAHGHDDQLFRPNDGYDDCRIWIVETGGQITEVRQQQFRLFPEYDAAIIDQFQATTKYQVSKASGEIQSCNLLGYEAHAAPFQVRKAPSNRSLEIYNPRIVSAAQYHNGLRAVPTQLNVNAPDVKLSNKLGYLIDVKAKVGLSGGPMIDASDGSVVGICVIGLPADDHEKTQIGVIDLRQFPFI